MIIFRRNLFFVILQCFSLNVSEVFADSAKSFIKVEGGHLQHHMVKEAIDIIGQMHDQDLDGILKEVIIDLVNASISMSKEGNVLTSSRALDVCYIILDFASIVTYYAHQSAANGHFVIESLINNSNKNFWFGGALRSKESIEIYDVIKSYIIMAYFVGKLAQDIVQNKVIYDVLEMAPENAEEILKKYMIDSALVFTIYAQPIISEKKSTRDIVNEEYFRLLRGVITVFSIIPQKNLPVFLNCFYKGMQLDETIKDISVFSEEIQSLITIVKQSSDIDI